MGLYRLPLSACALAPCWCQPASRPRLHGNRPGDGGPRALLRRPASTRVVAGRPIANLRALERIDVLYNLGGAPLADRPWTKQRRRVLGESRVKVTEALLGILEALESPPRVFIGAGGLGKFGDRGDEILDDDDVPGAGFLAELCVEWEQASLDAARRIGARAAVLRMSVALSPTGGAFPLMVRAFRYFGGWLGHGRQYTTRSARSCTSRTGRSAAGRSTARSRTRRRTRSG